LAPVAIMLQPFKGKDRSAMGSLAKAFWRLGWIGFWVQVGLGAIPILMFLYASLFAGGGTRARVTLVEVLTVGGLLVLAFTILWSYRYTRLAKQIADPAQRPLQSTVQRIAWIGVAGSTLGLVFSMLVMLAETAVLLAYFLRAPQAGVPVIQTAGAASPSWVSAIDIVSLLSLILIAFGELVVLSFSQWLLFRSTVASAEFACPGGGK
jgi:hypothetical protein